MKIFGKHKANLIFNASLRMLEVYSLTVVLCWRLSRLAAK